MYVWALFYRVYHLAAPGGAGLSLTSLVDAVKHTLVLHHEFHFYFLHIMLLVYICLPVVRPFSAPPPGGKWSTPCWSGSSPASCSLSSRMSGPSPWSAPSPGGTCFPPALFLHRIHYVGVVFAAVWRYRRRWYLLSLACGAAFTFVSCSLLSLKYGVLAENLLSGWSPGPMLMSVGWFGLLLKVRVWPSRLLPGDRLAVPGLVLHLFGPCVLSFPAPRGRDHCGRGTDLVDHSRRDGAAAGLEWAGFMPFCAESQS